VAHPAFFPHRQSLLVKTLAKPLSKRIKHDFSRFDATKNLLITIGQTNHRVTSRMTIWSSGYRVKTIKPLETEKALKDGAEFVGEGFIFMVSVTILLWEYNRSQESTKQKQEAKRQVIKAEQERLKAKLHALDIRLKAVEDAIKEQTDTLLGLPAKPRYKMPPAQELVPIDDEDSDDDEEKGGKIEERFEAAHDNQERESNNLSSEQSKSWWKFW
jgi:hypothetical protein